MELYIIRHGQSTNNALLENQHLRVPDPALTDIGKQQAERVAQYLATCTDVDMLVRYSVDAPERAAVSTYPITHVYCSPMYRTLQTAQPIARAFGLQPEVWIDIHEQGGIFLEENGSVKAYGGKTRSEILAEFANYALPDAITEAGWWVSQNGKESVELCHARAMRVARRLKERAAQPDSQDHHIALVSHGAFIASLLKALLNLLPGDHFDFYHYNTAITRVVILATGEVAIRCLNRTVHLPPELLT